MFGLDTPVVSYAPRPMFVVYVSEQQIVLKLPYPPQNVPSTDRFFATSLWKGRYISGNLRLDL